MRWCSARSRRSGAEGAAVVMTLLDQIVAVQSAGQPSENGGIGHPLIYDFDQLLLRQGAPPVKVSQSIRPVEQV